MTKRLSLPEPLTVDYGYRDKNGTWVQQLVSDYTADQMHAYSDAENAVLRAENVKLQKTIDAAWAAIGNDQMTAYIKKFGEPVPLVAERDALRVQGLMWKDERDKLLMQHDDDKSDLLQMQRENVKMLRSDCRTCRHSALDRYDETICHAVRLTGSCIEGDLYAPLPPVKLWRPNETLRTQETVLVGLAHGRQATVPVIAPVLGVGYGPD